MSEYFLTKKAVIDLTEIWDYTFKVWSEKQADKYYYELLNDCHFIANNPKCGKKYKEIHKDISGYKSGNHIIFYRVLNKNKVEITRFLHSRMDLAKRIYE